MPRELYELYRQTLERIQKQAGDDGVLGMRILSWITHAKRPLSVDELRYGLAVEYNDDDDDEGKLKNFDEENLLSPGSLVDVCAGLVVIDSTSQIIRLVHFTTQEYFDKTRLHLFKDAELDISRACLSYLSYDFGKEFLSLRIALQSHPFLNYASHHWFSHARRVILAEDPSPMVLKVVARFKSSDSISISTDLLCMLAMPYFRFRRFKDCETRKRFPLQVASYLGLEELVTVLLDHSTGSCPGMDTSLVIAAMGGDYNIRKLLLQYGVQVSSTRKPGGRYTALGDACWRGHLSVMKILIGHGAKINSPAWGTHPPLHAAAFVGDAITVDFLLMKGADVNARDCLGNTACHKATSCRSGIDIVKRLVDAHCDLKIANTFGQTALHCAVAVDNPIIVDFLLKEGADVNARGYNGRTACHEAAWSFRRSGVDIVKCLVDAHCDLEITDDAGKTALHYAAGSLYPDMIMIELLLDKGADASAKNKKGETARNVVEKRLTIGARDDLGPEYQKNDQQLLQRMLQLEQNASAPAANDL